MMERLRGSWPPGIRAQLTMWYTVVFAALILLFGVIFYTTLQASLTASVDTTLQLRTQQIATGIASEGGKITIQDVTGELPGLSTPAGQHTTSTDGNQNGGPGGTDQTGGQADVNFGTLVRILNVNNQTFYITAGFRALTVPSASITQAFKGNTWQGTVTASNGQQVRLYSVPLTSNGTIFGVLQVGESLAQLTATLQSIALALLVITPFVLLLSAFVSYWLAKRAFGPMLRLTRTAREIKAGDLHRRVPLPAARDEVHDLALTLNEMIERLERAFTQQRRFVADASHELRTPVSVIRSMTEVAMEQPLQPEECASLLGDINAETERLGQLIDDLLTLARADEGQIALDRDEVRLDHLAADVAAAMEPLAIERLISLQVGKLEPAMVMGDTARLIQCMLGLVDNALIYTGAGGSVTLTVKIDELNAYFAVRDTGIGIAPEDLPHIFERFYRADPARSRAVGGSGLGLAIAKWIVEAQGGVISVESKSGQGSVFTLQMALAATEVRPSDLTPGQSPAAETQPLHR